MSTVPPKTRATALDALRGIAIIGMILSGHIAHGGVLPAWMHHAQVPPPNHQFNPNIPGITWVDLVFPVFLFAMGMAFPFSMRQRLAKGVSEWQITFQAFQRWGWLFFFALFYQHLIPQYMNTAPGALEQLLALGGFLLMFAVFGTHPKIRRWKHHRYVNIIGLILATGYLFILPGTPKEGQSIYLSVERTDIIILILANVAFFGAVAWLFTRDNILSRLLILVALLALRLSQSAGDNWTTELWAISPLPWFFNFSFLQYLHIVLAGSIIGDLTWAQYQKGWGKANGPYPMAIGCTLVVIVLTSLTGLFARWGFSLLLIQAGFLGVTFLLLKKVDQEIRNFLFEVLKWGAAFLMIGMLLEPYEGGIKKDHATVSYYYVTSGLATFLFVGLFLFLDYKPTNRMAWLTDTGSNPMIAYVAPWLVIWPILMLSGFSDWVHAMDSNAWTGFLRGVLITGLSIFTTILFSRLGWRWKT